MSAGTLFSLQDQVTPAEAEARLHAAADAALAEAEYEFYAMRAELEAALSVPLRDRAITVETAEAEKPRTAEAA